MEQDYKEVKGIYHKKATDNTLFPAPFMMGKANEVLADSRGGGLHGWVYDGADRSQVALWIAEGGKGGYCVPHSHDYAEYCHVLSGWYRLEINGEDAGVLHAGDELYIEPGVVHAGWYSEDYRAIDGFEKRRFNRAGEGEMNV